MMLGAHLISSGRKFQSEVDTVSINRFPNVIVSLRFGTSEETPPIGQTTRSFIFNYFFTQ